MPTIQSRLVELPIKEKQEARKKALELIRNTYGNIPYPGEAVLEEGIWKVPIIARYPRVLVNEAENIPEKVRFMVFEDLGRIEIFANNGKIKEKPTYWQLQSSIKDELELIQTAVWKALVKVGANKFSNLPLSEHMHTPIGDVLSQLLINNTLDLEVDLGMLNEEDRTKYVHNIENLQFVGLVRRIGDIVEPDNALIEIERQSDTVSQALSNSLAYFFEKGYEHIGTIKQVLGPHLIVTGSIYQRAIEYGEVVFLKTKSIEDIVRSLYPSQPQKIFKLPRYLVQCASVGLIEKKIVAGENVWCGKEKIFRGIMDEEEILGPIRGFINRGVSSAATMVAASSGQ